MNSYQHSVSLDVEKCKGCTTCLRHCPTEAIRIRDGHAVINPERCIDCGECIRVCPNKAKKAIYQKFESIKQYKWKIALPAPTLYGQFDNLEDIDYVLQGLLDFGFDDVYEVSRAAELVSAYTRRYLKREDVKKPIISSACPVVVRLISLRFPSLCDQIMPILPPMEIAGMLAREKAHEDHPELRDEDICVCFISPCPAKVSYVNNGFSDKKSNVDAVISISDIYFALLGVMDKQKEPPPVSRSGMIGIGWASTGGESSAIFNDKYLAADGIDNVIRVLDQIEDGNIPELEFIELNACNGGCVGGAMAMENPYIAKARLQTLRRYLPVSRNWLYNNGDESDSWIPDAYFFEELPSYQPCVQLSDDRSESFKMMADIQKIMKRLPDIDCGSCGAPSCHAFAEDVVRGEAKETDCVIWMREQIEQFLAGQKGGEQHDGE
ncbi:MAG: 4Fe-4S dicluster domain-containing protein [Oscillospiraceae bacterium]|nr:4Fe-4S dicluster domain-containing protein [Oscillospiraceae bacterium]